MSDDCVFCGIADGSVPAEDLRQGSINPERQQRWLAFTPLNPATPGHTLVIPSWHVGNILELSGAYAGELMAKVHRIAVDTWWDREPDGMNIITSAGEAASQTVMHLHWHVVPRYHGDRLGDIWAGARHESIR